MTVAEVVERLGRERATAILRCSDAEVGAEAMSAAIRAGFRVVEVTLTTPGACELIGDLARRDDLLVGAGTVLTREDAQRAVEAGARFLVSPVTDVDIIAAAASLGVAAMPGGHTPTELLAAHRAGAPFVKLFPAPAGGPAWLRSVLAPLPLLRVVPTNGVDEGNAGEWLAAGAWAVGLAAVLFAPEDLANRRYERIEERAGRLLAAVRSSGASQPAAGSTTTSNTLGQSLPVSRNVPVSGR